MKPPEPRCAFITTPIMSAEPIAMTHAMPTVASTKPTGTPTAISAKNAAPSSV